MAGVTGAVLSPVVDVESLESAAVVDEADPELEAGADPAPEELSLLAAGAAGLSVVVVASVVLVAEASPAVELSGAAVDGLAVPALIALSPVVVEPAVFVESVEEPPNLLEITTSFGAVVPPVLLPPSDDFESVVDAFVEVVPAAATWLVSEPLESTVDAGESGKVSNIL